MENKHQESAKAFIKAVTKETKGRNSSETREKIILTLLKDVSLQLAKANDRIDELESTIRTLTR